MRGVGLRLHAAVAADCHRALPAARPEPGIAAAAPERSRAGALRSVPLVFVLLLVAVVALFVLRAPQPELLDVGYGLTRDDILSEQSETAAILVDAFKSEAKGEDDVARQALAESVNLGILD